MSLVTLWGNIVARLGGMRCIKALTRAIAHPAGIANFRDNFLAGSYR
jgi:hypothetical protein